MPQLEIWIDASNTEMCDRTQAALSLAPDGLGVRLESIATTDDGRYKRFIAEVEHPQFAATLRQQLSGTAGVWVGERPPGVG